MATAHVSPLPHNFRLTTGAAWPSRAHGNRRSVVVPWSQTASIGLQMEVRRCCALFITRTSAPTAGALTAAGGATTSRTSKADPGRD